MKSLIKLTFTTTLFLFFITPIFSQEKSKFVFAYKEQANIHQAPDNNGFYKDFFTKVLSESGHEMEILRLPDMKYSLSIIDGSADFTCDVPFAENNYQYMIFLRTSLIQKPAVITNKKVKSLKNINDLKKYEIYCTNSDYTKTLVQQGLKKALTVKKNDLPAIYQKIINNPKNVLIMFDLELSIFSEEEKVKIKLHRNIKKMKNDNIIIAVSKNSKYSKIVKNPKFKKNKKQSVNNQEFMLSPDCESYSFIKNISK